MTTRGRPRSLERWATCLAFAATLVALVGCSSGDDAELNLGDTTTLTPSTAPATTPAPTTIAPPTTPPPATTEPAPEPSTTDPPDLESQIRADFARTWDAFFECGANPTSCDISLIAVERSPAAIALRQDLDFWISENLRADLNSGPRELEIESVAVVDDKRALIVTCITDGTWLMDIGNPADPADDKVFNDQLNSYRTEWTMELTNSGWRRVSGERLGLFVGATECDV